MKLYPPCQAIDFAVNDIYGEPIRLSDLQGQRVLLSFFRDAACPFCNLRVYELTHNYTEWRDQGLEVVTFFSSSAEQVRQHVAKHPRPFRMISDPELAIYQQYGIERSASALLRALLFRMPRILRGIAKGGRPSRNPHVTVVPADFLLTEEGRVEQVYYGRDTADHIPLERVRNFIAAGQPDDDRDVGASRDVSGPRQVA